MRDGVTDGGHSPVKIWRLKLIWLPMPNYTPQQADMGKERWGRPKSGRALMLGATETQVIEQMGDGVTDGGRSSVKTRRLRLIWLLVPNYTPQQPHGGKERWGRPESGRALMLAPTEPQVIWQMRDGVTDGGCSHVKLWILKLIWLPMPNYTPQQPQRDKERCGRPESGRALMLVATEPQVIQ